MIDRWWGTLVMVVCLALPLTALADAVEDVAALLRPVERFSAEFTQTVLGARGELRENAQGYVRIERPRRFKWVVEDPYPQLIVTQGQALYVYDPDLDQVQIRTMDEALEGTPALVLTGDAAQIAAHFEVTERHEDGLRVFTFVPRSESALYTEMHMTFDQGQLAAIDIRDSLGQSTEVRFFNADTTPAFPANEFEFTVPPSADVIGDVVPEPA
ncbi:MAG: outer membrane lipoprotein chaperone LolA [Gammaproteobacteria bacterium]|nr:outer membrane lipoprotein chaperone LolA [Gammaproteobacteria bacterium]